MAHINHVSVSALDLEESVQFYEDLLGAERLETSDENMRGGLFVP